MDFSTRYDLLKTVIARYDGYYHLSAVKASLLLTANAILLTALVSEESALLSAIDTGGAALLCIFCAAMLSLASTALAALVIAAYLARQGQRESAGSVTFSWSVGTARLDDYRDRLAALTEESLIDDLTRLAHALATGLTRKFVRINYSLWTFMGAILAVAMAFMVMRTGT